MNVSQVMGLKELEEVNQKLKPIYTDLALDNRILRAVIEKTLELEIKRRWSTEQRSIITMIDV